MQHDHDPEHEQEACLPRFVAEPPLSEQRPWPAAQERQELQVVLGNSPTAFDGLLLVHPVRHEGGHAQTQDAGTVADDSVYHVPVLSSLASS